MSSKDFQTLAGLSRWRRHQRNGNSPLWKYDAFFSKWTNQRDGHRVLVDTTDPYADRPVANQIKIMRLGTHSWDHEDRSDWIKVESAQHAINILAAYNVLPAELTSAYRAVINQLSNAMLNVPMVPASRFDLRYGITHKSAFVYRTKSAGPTRFLAWDNTIRPNPRTGEPVRWGTHSKIDGGHGRYLDPNNDATDAAQSILLDPEGVMINDRGTGTSTPESGQVYEPTGWRLADGDRVILMWPDLPARMVTLSLPPHRSGHGSAE